MTAAVADTGVQVCVAGTGHLPTLGLKPVILHRRAGIQDLSHIYLRYADTAMCRIRLPDRHSAGSVFHRGRGPPVSVPSCLHGSQVSTRGFPEPHAPSSRPMQGGRRHPTTVVHDSVTQAVRRERTLSRTTAPAAVLIDYIQHRKAPTAHDDRRTAPHTPQGQHKALDLPHTNLHP